MRPESRGEELRIIAPELMEGSPPQTRVSAQFKHEGSSDQNEIQRQKGPVAKQGQECSARYNGGSGTAGIPTGSARPAERGSSHVGRTSGARPEVRTNAGISATHPSAG
jgi:hypothetical protein